MLEINDNTYYTLPDIIDGLGWKQATLYDRMRDGALPFYKVGRKRCIRGKDLLNYLALFREEERE